MKKQLQIPLFLFECILPAIHGLIINPFGKKNHLLKKLLLVVVIGLTTANLVKAEGSGTWQGAQTGRQSNLWVPSTTLGNTGYDTRGFMMLPYSASYNPAYNTSHRFLVYAKSGETVFFGFHSTAANTVTLNWYYDATSSGFFPTGISGSGRTVYFTQASFTIGGAEGTGRPATQASALNGPSQVTGTGYTAYSFVNNTGADRAFWFEISGASGFQIDFWDVTVASGTAGSYSEHTGRVYCKNWCNYNGLPTTNGSPNTTSFHDLFGFYIPIDNSTTPGNDYYVKYINFKNCNGGYVNFFSNSTGPRNNLTVAENRRSISGATYITQYPLFLNNPDVTLWPSATIPTINVSIAKSKNPNPGYGGQAIFTVTVDNPAIIDILIDINNNGIYDGTDVLITQDFPSAGTYDIYWNGRDANGNNVLSGTTITLITSGEFYPAHFPIYDMEQCLGVTVHNVRPGTNGENQYIHWDDSGPGITYPGTSQSVQINLTGVLSPNHIWWANGDNGFSQNNTINTWIASEKVIVSQEFQFNWNINIDLGMTKSVNIPNPVVGTNVIFTVTAHNYGPIAASGVNVSDPLPLGYTYVSHSGGTYNSGTGTWAIGTLAIGANAGPLLITATVNASGNYTNTATVTQSENDTVSGNNSASASVTPTTPADLAIVKTVNNPTPYAGNNIIFTLLVTNNGPTNATGVSVADLLPSGYTYVSDNGGGAYNSVTGVWTIGSLNNGSSTSLLITATVNVSGTYLNSATVSGNEADPVPENNTDTETIGCNAVVYGTVLNSDESICSGGDPSNITFSSLPSGGNGVFTYQWYYKASIVDCPTGSSTSGWTLIEGETGNSYNPPAGLTASRTYAVLVNAAALCAVSPEWASGCRKVTVINPPTAPANISVDRSCVCPSDGGNISLQASGGSGATLTWYASSCGGTPIGTGSPLVIPAPSSTTTYYVRWESAPCSASSCLDVTVVVDVTPPVLGDGKSWPTDNTGVNSCMSNAPAGPSNATIAALYTDACGGTITVTQTNVPSGTDCIWSVVYTYSIKDNCNNEVTPKPTFTVSGGDITPPVLGNGNSWPSNNTGVNSCMSNAPAGPSNATIAALYTDACGGTISVTQSNVPSGTDCLWSVVYTYSIKDKCNNEVTPKPTFTVSGGDITPPVLGNGNSWPSNNTGVNSCLSNAPAGPSNATIAALYTDACGGTISVTQSNVPSGTDCLWSVVYTYSIKDKCNNEVTPKPTFIVSGGDITPPVLGNGNSWPSNNTGVNSCMSNAPAGPSNATIAALYTDACGGTISVTQSNVPSGTDCIWSVVYTYTIKDKCNNEVTPKPTFTVSGGDITPPVLGNGNSWPSNNTGVNSCMSNAPAGPSNATIAALYTDACGGTISVTQSNVPSGTDCLWSVVYTYSIKDKCNNEVTPKPTFTVSGGDITPPVLGNGNSWPTNNTGVNSCMSNAPAGPSNSTIAALYTDACGGTISVTQSNVPSGTDCLWSVVYTYSIKDKCNNEVTPKPTFTVSGGDITPPVLGNGNSWPSNNTGVNSCMSNAPAGPSNATIAALYTDACGGTISVTQSNVPSGTDCNWSVVYTYSIKDKCNNEVTPKPTFTVSGGDNTPPVLGNGNSWPSNNTGVNSCKSNAPAGPSNATIAALYADACGGTITVSQVNVPSGTDCNWSVVYTYTIKDKCNNEVTPKPTFTVSGGDSQPPSLTCPGGLMASCTVPAAYANYTAFVTAGGSASDNCSLNEGSFAWVSDVSDGNTNPEVITRTYKIADNCGNETECEQTITLREVNVVTWVYLEGAAIAPGGSETFSVPMRTTLNTLKVLPGQTFKNDISGTYYTPPGQPYSGAPWLYTGTEGSGYDSYGNPTPGTANYPSTVVDWVLVSLRDAPDGASLCRQAALLHKDGHVEFVNGGFSCCALNLSDSYYLVIEHRNHLIIMSPEPLPIVNGTLTFDFRSNQSYIDDPIGFGGFGQKKIISGIYAMFAGNGDQIPKGDINLNDRTYWEGQNLTNGRYRNGDYNMNGDCNYNDRITYEFNNGKFTTVP